MTIDLVTQIETRPQARKTLKEADRILLQILARVKFATWQQLSYWSGANWKTVYRRLTDLQAAGLVSFNEYYRPAIWSITYRGARLMLAPLPSGGRRSDWSVMSHTCHLNQAEILLDQTPESKGFRFHDRLFFWKRGLNPAFGEHCGEDNAKRAYLVILDDYLMKPERIGHTWTRTHHPPRKYFDGNRTLSWSKIVNHFIVATTDEFRAEQHAAWIERHEIPARVITIKPLWG